MNEETATALTRLEPRSGTGLSGDGKFECFLQHQRRALVSFLRKRVFTEEDAQDAAQESMVRLLNYRDAVEPEAWRPLLYRIAVNVVHDQARRMHSRRFNEHVSYEETLHAVASNEPSHDEQLIRKQMMDRLWQIILALPERTQEIYVLNRVDGMSYQQVARHCGVSVSAVEKHMSRALLALRNGLGEVGADAF
jgi:RNA polymerase sigma-70 factor (ECF subfamily)